MLLADDVKMLLPHFCTVFIHWKWAMLAQVCQQVELTHCHMYTSVGLCVTSRSFHTETSSFPNILWYLKTLFFFYQCFLTAFSQKHYLFSPKAGSLKCLLLFHRILWASCRWFAFSFFLQYCVGKFWSRGELQLECKVCAQERATLPKGAFRWEIYSFSVKDS